MSQELNRDGLEAAHLLDVLKESVSEVFNSLVFTFEEAAVKTVEEPEGRRVEVTCETNGTEALHVETEARVDFEGLVNGCVVLRCSAEGAFDIARGLLMMDESEALEVEEVADALGECANMVTGSLKTKALDPKGEFHMSTPTVSNEPRVPVGDPSGSLAYRLSQGLVAVEIWVQGEAA